jgi:hypothetical protein
MKVEYVCDWCDKRQGDLLDLIDHFREAHRLRWWLKKRLVFRWIK